jgi:hypothetical protein
MDIGFLYELKRMMEAAGATESAQVAYLLSDAVQRALERCTVEVLDGAGSSLGVAQMRPRITKPIAFTSKPATAKSRTIVPDVAAVPLSVQLLSGSAGEVLAVIATDRAIPDRSLELPVGEWLRVVVDRGIQKSGIIVTASLPGDVSARRAVITNKITELRLLKSACIAVRDVGKGARRGTQRGCPKGGDAKSGSRRETSHKGAPGKGCANIAHDTGLSAARGKPRFILFPNERQQLQSSGLFAPFDCLPRRTFELHQIHPVDFTHSVLLERFRLLRDVGGMHHQKLFL